MPFRLVSNYSPTGDQPQAIDTLVQSLKKKNTYQTLLGVTGSGKTFTMANIIAKLDRPTLVIAHNKTLAAQLAQEFKEFFPDNAVHYFVSYYDYYQPEAYIVKSDTYIEKEATINEEIDRFRHAATESLLSRRDVIIVASVSCIYGIGEVADYEREVLRLKRGEEYSLSDILDQLVYLQYKRSIADFKPGMFRLHGDTLEIYPSSSEDVYILEFFGDTLDRISRTEYLTHHHLEDLDNFTLFPAKHFITPKDRLEVVIPKIRKELDERVEFFRSQGDLLRAERIKMRVEYDLEMLQETGFINGIENYSLYLSDRKIGSAPTTLMDYFPSDYLTFIDESHMTIPQIGGMYAGDRARKTNLIENGFRLPSAFENRPLRFEEFEKKINQAVFVSATPADYE